MVMRREAATACRTGDAQHTTAKPQQAHNATPGMTVYANDKNWQKTHACCDAGCWAMCSLCGT